MLTSIQPYYIIGLQDKDQGENNRNPGELEKGGSGFS